VLYGKREKFEALMPYKVRPASNELPHAWETGTQNHECMAGVRAAVDYIATISPHDSENKLDRRSALKSLYELIHSYERQLTIQSLSGLGSLPDLTIYGITDPKRFDQRVGTVSIRIKNRTPQEIAKRLGEKGLFTWDGNFYALDLTERLGLEAKVACCGLACCTTTLPMKSNACSRNCRPCSKIAVTRIAITCGNGSRFVSIATEWRSLLREPMRPISH
jgi:selenocysteine lyase/cysteine desulfurase